MQALLSFAGRHGPALLFASAFVGIVCPTFADAAQPLMGAAVFVFTAGGFLKVGRSAFAQEFARPTRLIAILAWTLLGVPLVAWAVAGHVVLPAGVAAGMILCMAAPPVGSAAAIAAMLRMNTAQALVGSVAISLLSPLYLPALVQSLGAGSLAVDTTPMMARIACIVLGAAATSALLRRFASCWLERHPDALTGASVLGLIVVGLGVMKGIQPLVIEHGGAALLVVLIAFAVNVAFQCLGVALFLPLGRRDAATVGLLSGYRNVTLVAVAAAPWLAGSPQVHLYIAASVLPIFVMPLLSTLIARHLAGGGGAETMRRATESGSVVSAIRHDHPRDAAKAAVPCLQKG